MASSKVMASTSPPNPDRPRNPTSLHLPTPLSPSAFGGSMNMEGILKNIYSDSADPFASAAVDGGAGGKTVDEVWKEIVSAGGGAGSRETPAPAMTLEDFLTKAGAVGEEDGRVPVVPPPPPPSTPAGGFSVDSVMNTASCQFPVIMQNGPAGFAVEPQLGFGSSNGVVAIGGGGRGKRRATVEEVPMDRATQQKQRRMIKNRESAARSRERKQAYTVELESQVTRLEEENARLLKEEAEQQNERLKQLMENLIPVVEKRRPPRVLRRVHSMEW